MVRPSYRQLFALLEELGFEELTADREAGFYHEGSHTILAFSRIADTDTVCEADLISVQSHLRLKGLIAGDLIEALGSTAVSTHDSGLHFLSRNRSDV